MSFGVTNLFDIAAPTTGYTHSSSRKKTLEPVTLRNQLGVTKCVSHVNHVLVEVSTKGKGDHALGSLAAATLDATGEIQIYSKKRTETLKEYPDFEVQAKGYEDVGTITNGDAEDAVDELTASAGCPVIGITSVSIAAVTSWDIEEKLEEAEAVFDTDGTFDHQDFFDPMYEFSVKGRGDFPAILVLGSDGGLPDTVTEFSAGITFISEISEEQENENESSWEASGFNWPAAA